MEEFELQWKESLENSELNELEIARSSLLRIHADA